MKNASADLNQVKQWGESYPHENIGIATGSASGLVVLDIDPKNGGGHSFSEVLAKHGALPETMQAYTPSGGRHYYFRLPAGRILRTRISLLPGIDFLAEDSYAVAPTSYGVNGTYHWVPDHSPAEIEAAELPKWLLDLATAADEPKDSGADQRTVDVDDLKIKADMKRLIRDGKSKGQRSEAVFAVVRCLVMAGYDDAIITSVMMDGANGISDKPREKGLAWLQGEIRRARDKPNDQSKASNGGGKSTSTSTPALVCMADVQREEVDWLWYPYIPKGKLTSIDGDPGIGKSHLTLALTAAVTRGHALPGEQPTQPGNVVLLTAEDGLGDTVRPRLDDTDADLSRIYALEGRLPMDDTGLEWLAAAIADKRPDLVIIDPIYAYAKDGLDMNKANHVRSFMAPLASIAGEYGAAIVMVRHLAKGEREKAMYKGLGSIDLTAACRSVLMVGKHPDDEAVRVMTHAKSNLAPLGPSLSYTLDDGFEWGDEVAMSADELFQGTDKPRSGALEKAKQFLSEQLAEKNRLASSVIEAAKNAGISERTLMRAKKELGVQSQKVGDEWVWLCLAKAA